jgi:CRP-like cAMP-binding protein
MLQQNLYQCISSKGVVIKKNAPPQCSKCNVLMKSIFCGFNQDQLDLNSKMKIFNFYKKGQALIDFKTPYYGIFCIKSGLINFSTKNKDGTITSKELGPGSTIGMCHLEEEYTDFKAEALTDTVACFFDKKYVKEIMENEKSLKDQYANKSHF